MTKQQFQIYLTRNLKWAILDSGIRQSDLARLAKVDRSLLNHYINGNCLPSLTNLSNICYALDIELDDIIDVEICKIIE